MSSQGKKSSKTAYFIVFIIYCIVMLWLLFGRRQYQIAGNYREIWGYMINIRPFKTIHGYLYVLQNREEAYLQLNAAVNLFGNILLFIPYGIFLPYLFPRLQSFFKTLLCGLITIICVEILQVITLRGSCDIDDLILNMAGIIPGYIVYRIAGSKRE